MNHYMRMLKDFFQIDTKRYEAIEQHEAVNSNHSMLRAFSVLAFACIFILFLLSSSRPGLLVYRSIYLYGTLISALIFILNCLFWKFWKQGILHLVYFTILAFLAYGMHLGIVTKPELQSTGFMVLMLFLPSLFIDRPFRVCGTILASDIIFLILVNRMKSGSVLTADVSDAIIYGVVSIFSNFYLLRLKYRRYQVEEDLRTMGEKDQLTGVNNRNSFESKFKEFDSIGYQKNMTFIYLDVNGLHELNNTKGHDAGDQMLKTVAESLLSSFRDDDIYRIGGDEFVVMYCCISEQDIRYRIMKIQRELEAKDYSCAMGYSILSEGESMDELMKKAESRMFEDKEKFYKLHVKDRR